MESITIITSSNSELIMEKFDYKVKDPVNLFVRGIANITNFSSVDIFRIQESQYYDLFIIEDELDNLINYFEILQDAKYIKNIIVTTELETTIAVFGILSSGKFLEKVAAIFLDFDLRASTDHSVNEINASAVYEMIDNSFYAHGQYDARIIAITAFEHEENKYGALKQKMRANGDFVLNKSILRDEKSQMHLKTILKSVDGFYWKNEALKKTTGENSIVSTDKLEYEKRHPIPKGIDSTYRLLKNIENVLPIDEKFQISKDGIKVYKPNSDEKYSSYIALGEAIVKSAKKIVWILNHPSNRESYPKFRKQFHKYSVFKTQINKGNK